MAAKRTYEQNLELAKARGTAAKKAVAKNAPEKQLSLELWPDAVRGVPNAVLRGSLFSVSKVRATAKKRELLEAVEVTENRFKGERSRNLFNRLYLNKASQGKQIPRIEGSVIDAVVVPRGTWIGCEGPHGTAPYLV